MTYVGVIASAVLHVGGLALLLSARAPDPLVPLGADTPLDVSIVSEQEYAALTSRAPDRSTLDALREQPSLPALPDLDQANPEVDTSSDTETPPEPEPVELAMRPPAPVADALPAFEPEEPPQPDSSEVERAPAPAPLAVEPEAMRDRQVDPADLIPQDDVEVAIAPPAPKPPRGVFDTLPEIDLTPDEPPEPAETEGDSEAAEEPAPAPEAQPEPVETAKADDPAPLSTPMPVMKPRGSLAVASTEEEVPPAPAPAEVAEVAPPVPAPPLPEPEPEPEATVDPVLGLTAAELEEERRMMEAIQEQMRATLPPTEEELRAAEAEALAKLAEEQERARELAALDDAERREREEEDRRARAEAERVAAAERDAAAAAAAEREARARADLLAQQRAVAEAERARQEAIRQARIEAQQRAQAELERRQREERARIEEQRQREIRRQQLANLNGTVSPEDTARNVLSAPSAPAAPQSGGGLIGGDRLASILGAADNFANRASTGPSFSQGGNVRQGASLTPGETQAVLDQLRSCWRVDTFSANARSQVVTLQAQIRQNGFVNQATIQVVSPRPTPPEYRIAVERAMAALQDRRCQPFNLPAQKYSAWRDIVIRFDPAQMVLQ